MSVVISAKGCTERAVEGDVLKIHGIKQQIVDLAKEEIIAERSNYLIGGDFNRSFFCLGANWYRGNDGFADRVLGNRYIEEKTGKRYPDPKPEIYLKSVLIKTEDVTAKGVFDRYETALPAGSIRDYNNRVIILPEGIILHAFLLESGADTDRRYNLKVGPLCFCYDPGWLDAKPSD